MSFFLAFAASPITQALSGLAFIGFTVALWREGNR